MKTTVVPAQITSVEDRVAGNFTFAQILLLIAALLLGTVLYVFVAPRLHLSALKLSLIGCQFGLFGGLALRYQGKILAQWLVVYLRFYLRPRLYVFTKKDLINRDIELPVVKKAKPAGQPQVRANQAATPVSLLDQVVLDRLVDNPSLSVSFELSKKGGIDVSLTPSQD